MTSISTSHPATRVRHRRTIAVVSLAAASAMVLTGCRGHALGAAPIDPVVTTPVLTTAPPPPVDATNLELPRTVSYAGVEYSITKVTLHATDPINGSDASNPPGPARGVLVTMEAKNTTTVDLQPAKADLTTGTEVEVAAINLEQRDAADRLAGSSTTAVRAFFQTDLDDVSASTFSIREAGRVPVTIPLKGAVPATGYPVKGKVGPGLGAVGVFNGGSSTVKIDVIGAEVRLDSLPVYPARAEIGHRFVVLSGRLKIAKSLAGSPAYFTFGYDIRLLADDLATAPSECTGDPYDTAIMVSVGEVAEFACAFPVKDSATTFAVSTGYANARLGSVLTAPIELGPLPAVQ